MSTRGINNSSAHLKVKTLQVIKGGDSKTTTQLKTLWVQQFYAKADRDSLRASLETLSVDAKITVAEKVYLQTEWTKITADHAVIVQDAEQYSLTAADEYTLYVAAFIALSAYITPILAVPDEDTTILQVQYNSLFDTYFSTFNVLSQLIIYSQISGEVPSYEELVNGFDFGTSGEATATPTTPTLTGEAIVGGVKLTVDKQANLKFLKEYHFQVSQDGSNWYALGMDGLDWKTGGQGGYTSYPGESFMHTNLPPVQLIVLGTWSSGSDVITISLGTGQLAPGDLIAGSGIPVDSTIQEILSLNSVRISAATTASGVGQALLIGDDIEGNGENKKYMGIQLYYRARRVTVAEVISSWSSLVFLQAGQMQPGYIAAHSILLNQLIANIIEAGFAVVNYGATIGYAGIGTVGSPVKGDRRIYLDEDELTFQTYSGTVWIADGPRIGGTDNHDFLSMFFRGNGLFHNEAEEESIINMGEFIPNGIVFRFENSLIDQSGIYTLNMTAWGIFTDVMSKFFRYSLTGISTSSAELRLTIDNTDPAFDLWKYSSSPSISLWIYITTIGTNVNRRFLTIQNNNED